MEGKVEGIVDDLIRLADESGVRLGVLGGASSMLVSEGGPRLFDTAETAARGPARGADRARRAGDPEDRARDARLVLREPGRVLRRLGAAPVTGAYRLSDDVLLTDEDGMSEISGADLAAGRGRRDRAAAVPAPAVPRRPLSQGRNGWR